ncbi:hypothetical protein PACTADRAFT_45070 [Pachysolen tannophilus NRRL Y-2460]|uniref:Mannosyl-oligosaccharide glucosidase n=1 Tax=Pachysolen tannophilus NRRL Y-2460 TaxID=669874 RepID=A0A1E4TRP8_PACTA|nr:hypothetical protein PACTADRAFT_45070 [Pachysolen tannophilus NRRL Y-2460]
MKSYIAIALIFVYSIVCSSETVLNGNSENQVFIDQYSKASNASLLWGPYRSNLYLGIRPRIPHSLMTGLMWFNADDYQGVGKIKHACDQNDNLKGFGWTKYDPRTGGRQIIKDDDCKLSLITEFAKDNDGNWGLKIKGIPKKGHEDVKTSLIFYAGLEGDGILTSFYESDIIESTHVKLGGLAEQLGGGFDIDITESIKNKKPEGKELVKPNSDPSKTHYLSLHVPDDNIWKAKDIFMALLKESIEELTKEHQNLHEVPPEQLFSIRNMNNFNGNLHFIQKFFVGEFELFITFNKENAVEKFTPENINSKIKSSIKHFEERFAETFELQPPFNSDKNYSVFAKDFLSNLLGGIGYFYGDSLVDRETPLDEVKFEPTLLNGKVEPAHELFTSVPSRSFFPRGFYWDEGFHLLPITEYDVGLSLEILKSWFSLIDEDGYISREQILGPEARSKVPPEFQVQNPHIANPPTMLLVFTKILALAKERHDQLIDEPKKVDEFGGFGAEFYENENLADAYLTHPELLINYAKEIYPKLQKHYEWFRKTQKGDLEEFERTPFSKNEAYRWRGRTQKHCLASGLDDYPRAESPDTAELNVDLISWIGVMTRSIKTMAELLDKQDDAQKYSSILHDISKNIDDLHWSEKDECYCDVTVDDNDEDLFVCNKGYVSLFPFLHKFIPANSAKIYKIVQLIRDPEELWSDYGIRSLSKSNKYFRTGEDYWRGNIWVNMNYLVLESLLHYGQQPDLVDSKTKKLIQDTYKNLRVNLVQNIFNEWERTGFAFEQYDENTGKGARTKHFLGWTALAISIMKMPEQIK